jgi:hypothetical protein
VTPRLPWSNLHVIKNNTHCWFFFLRRGEQRKAIDELFFVYDSNSFIGWL